MAELILLSFYRKTVNAIHRDARQGNIDAIESFEHIWEDYKHIEIECYLCGHTCQEFPPHTMMLPDPANALKLIGAPLCIACAAKPKLLKYSRCFKMLRKMHQAKTG